MKKYFVLISLFLLISIFSLDSLAQNGSRNASPPPPPKPATRLTTELMSNLEKILQGEEVSRERREKAYAKLLEGQRYLWSMRRLRTGFAQTSARLAKNALQEAIKLNPKLAEAYTALSELALVSPPQDINEAINLAKIATKLDKDNFGGHRILARLYTIKSNLGRGKLNAIPASEAIKAWKEVSRLDSRNAEAWGFLSEFYKAQNKQDLAINALRRWRSSATPLEPGFFNNVMRRRAELTLETASLKLGAALIEKGDSKDALEVLSRAVADNPRNLQAVELFKQALDGADKNSLVLAVETLRQVVFVNPKNDSLIQLLAQTLAKTGQVDDAAKVLRGAIANKVENNKPSASNLQVILGDILAESKRINEAISAYQNALKIRGIGNASLATDDDRDFAIRVVGKMIQTYKNANRPTEAKSLIDKYRIIFGKDDLFADKELISLLRETGNNQEALKVIQKVRLSFPNDYNLLRTEASVLTDLGRVDDGVLLVENLIKKKPIKYSPSIKYDDYVNYIYISSLYIQAKRPQNAVESAQKALQIAQGKDRKQIAKLSLASAYQSANDYLKAENLLKSILKETPGYPIALNNLGYLYLVAGKNYNEALELIKQAVQIEPNNSSYLDSLGWAYYKLGEYEKAKKYLERAAFFAPNSPTILDHLGDVYQKLGNSNQAKNSWQKALTHTFNSDEINRLKTKINK